MTAAGWPEAEVIRTARLVLEPLRLAHADEVAAALDDPRLHEFIGGRPARADELRDRFDRMIAGHSPDGSQGWLNWVVRDAATGAVVGTVQATMTDRAGHREAEVAWVVATPHQRRGYATEAAAGMVAWLREHGVDELVAHLHPDHVASAAVAGRLGLTPTDVTVDGETEWRRPPDQ